MTTTPLRFGLIGTGRIGRVHASAIDASADATLTWVCDAVEASADEVAAQYGAKATTDAADIFTSGEVDAVLIASPTPTHVDLIAAAVEASVPVLCEKPIDLDIARVEALRAIVSAAGVPVAVGFNRRFDPSFASVRERVAAGEIGTLEQLTIISRDPAPPPAAYVRLSGGIFRDMTIHDFDMARFFLPDIVEVSAFGSNTFDPGAREHGDFDTAVTMMRSSSGAIVTIVNSRHSAVGYDQRLEAFGGLGMLSVANAPTSLVSLSTASSVESKPAYQDFFIDRYATAYMTERAAFVALVRGERSSSSRYEDDRAALILADAAQHSATENIAVPVDLS